MLLELIVVVCLVGGTDDQCIKLRAETPDCVAAFQELKSGLTDEAEIRAIGCRPLSSTDNPAPEARLL